MYDSVIVHAVVVRLHQCEPLDQISAHAATGCSCTHPSLARCQPFVRACPGGAAAPPAPPWIRQWTGALHGIVVVCREHAAAAGPRQR